MSPGARNPLGIDFEEVLAELQAAESDAEVPPSSRCSSVHEQEDPGQDAPEGDVEGRQVTRVVDKTGKPDSPCQDQDPRLEMIPDEYQLAVKVVQALLSCEGSWRLLIRSLAELLGLGDSATRRRVKALAKSLPFLRAPARGGSEFVKLIDVPAARDWLATGKVSAMSGEVREVSFDFGSITPDTEVEAATSATNAASPEAPAGFRYHPAADLFPLIEGTEFDDLVTDIQANGQRESIKLLGGKVIDGRNRLRACLAAGKEPRVEDIQLTGSATEYVVSLNLRRRHLTPAQRAALAVEIAEQMAVEAKDKQRAAGLHGTRGGRGHKAPETLGDGSSARVSGTKEAAKSTTRAAKSAGAGVTATKKLARIKKAAPEVFQRAKAGEVSVAEAERIVSRAKGEEPEEPVIAATPASISEEVEPREDTDAGQELSGPPDVGAVRAAVRAIQIATGILRARLPSLHPKRLNRILGEVIEGGGPEGESNIAAQLMGEDLGAGTALEALVKAPPEGAHAHVDALRRKLTRYMEEGRRTDLLWGHARSEEISVATRTTTEP